MAIAIHEAEMDLNQRVRTHDGLLQRRLRGVNFCVPFGFDTANITGYVSLEHRRSDAPERTYIYIFFFSPLEDVLEQEGC